MEDNKKNQNESPTTSIETLSGGLGVLSKISDLIEKHGFWGILKSLIMYVLFGYCVFFVANPTYMFEKYDDYKDKQHQEQILQTFKSTSEINDMLKTYMYSEADVDRIFYIEFHNSIKGLDKMPYVFGSFRHEFTKGTDISYISDEFKDDFMLSKYQVFDYIYRNGMFCGSIDELRNIDERSAVMLSYANINHLEMILIENNGVPVGVLGVTTKKHIDNMYDLTRIGYTLLAKKLQ